MISFRLARTEADEPVVEVFRDDVFLATIYGHQEGIRVISKYYDGIQGEPGWPPSVVIKFSVASKRKKQ